jgi:hypothetical protein
LGVSPFHLTRPKGLLQFREGPVSKISPNWNFDANFFDLTWAVQLFFLCF